MKNALSIDVEDYFHVSAFSDVIDRQDWSHFESRVESNTEKILRLLDEYEVQATFFVLGWVAERFPGLVRSLGHAGHDIACHSYAHQLIYQQTPEAFRSDLRQSVSILEDIVGEPITGYRAPSYSITQASIWALDILMEEGFVYDSSIFPIYHDRYGIPGAERYPHVLKRGDRKLLEFPLSTLGKGKVKLPISGGGYFRLLPYEVTRWGIRQLNASGCPAIFYLHPWEFDPLQPRMRGKRLSQFRHYTNLEKTEKRFRTLLTDFSFAPVQEVLEDFLAASAKLDKFPIP